MLANAFAPPELSTSRLALQAVPRTPLGKAPSQYVAVGGPGTPRTPMQNGVFQFPPVPEVSDAVHLPIDEGEYLQPQKLGKPIVWTKQNGVKGEDAMAQNPDYFAMPPVISPPSTSLSQIAAAAPTNNKRRNDRRPPNLKLQSTEGIERAEPTPNLIRSPVSQEPLSNLANPYAMPMSAGLPLRQQHYAHGNYQNGDSRANVNAGHFEMQRNRPTLSSSGASIVHGNFIVSPLQDSKV